LSRLSLIAALLLPLAPRAIAEEQKAPPRALDVLRGGGFGGRDSESVASGGGPSGGRAAARPHAALPAKTADRTAPKSVVPAPGAAAEGSTNTFLGLNKTVLAGGAALGGIVVIALSGGAIIPVVIGAALVIGGGAYLLSAAKDLAKNITNPLERATGR